MSSSSTFAAVPLLSNVQLTNELALTLLLLLGRIGESISKLQVMSKGLLNGLTLPLVMWWAVMLTVFLAAVAAAGGASGPAAETGAAEPATNIAAPVPRVAANAATGRRVTNTEILLSTCIPYL
jgi:hypothetical protein